MNPEDIARYLATHPEFFDLYPHLLTDVRVTHPFDGRAISIAERQILNLREKISLLENRLAEFVRFGEENDATAQKMHVLALDLVAAKDLPALLAALYYHLRLQFSLPCTVARLWDGRYDGYDGLSECQPCEASVMEWVSTMQQPQCGAWLHPDAIVWLGDVETRSYAAIPLRGARDYGVLILASEEAGRFFPEMGTLYLERLGQLAAAALERLSIPVEHVGQ